MNIDAVFSEIETFSKESHGSSDYYKDDFFVEGKAGTYAPLSYLQKKTGSVQNEQSLLEAGFITDSFELFTRSGFKEWYQEQFSRKLTRKASKEIKVIHLPDTKMILDAIEMVNKSYEVLRGSQIVLNGKNLPVQLGEWYAKCVFGLEQIKSTSQRGFDFYAGGKRVEVKIHWADQSSPKGVKLRKSLVELSEFCIVVYMARNFMIREVCVLDSEFVMRKFAGKGHTIFLKDVDVSGYFFSNSKHHINKVVNSSSLMKFSSPTFAMKLLEYFQ